MSVTVTNTYFHGYVRFYNELSGKVLEANEVLRSTSERTRRENILSYHGSKNLGSP
jgi:hypothetical protein